jgi:predicted phage baseplate assembly protein
MWGTSLEQDTVKVRPGEQVRVLVTVAVPAGSQPSASDQGFLILRPVTDPSIAHIAAFETFASAVPTSARPQLAWEYSTGDGWSKLLVRDDSESLSRSGLVEFLGPSDFQRRREFGQDRFWVRASWTTGEYSFDPVLHRLLLNTIMASQTVTAKNEVLGSSNGTPGQRLRASHTPILANPRLEVREPELLSAVEIKRIKEQGGEDAISVLTGPAGRPTEIWVRWSQVPDFSGSNARDRHYVLDYVSGEIRFGDGLRGMIPPAASANIRLSEYRSGGGSKGNKLAGAVSQLMTTLPFVEGATNNLPASGGADAETIESLLARAPREIRHRDRAVTAVDFEDLALLASPGIARSLCVPLVDLAGDPSGKTVTPGTVSVIVVPRSTDDRPSPGMELIRSVSEFIESRATSVANIVVVGPQYIRVSVEADIALASPEGAGEVELLVIQALSRFLHPLTGGLNGAGWDFGRKPHKSDLYALIESVSGVDHVISLDVVETAEGEGDRFLVYSGAHTITLSFGEM